MTTLNLKMSRFSASAIEVQLNLLRPKGVTYARVDDFLSTVFTVYGPQEELQKIYRSVQAYNEATRLYSHELVIPTRERALYSAALKNAWEGRVKIPRGFFKDEVTVMLTGTTEELRALEREINRLRLLA